MPKIRTLTIKTELQTGARPLQLQVPTKPGAHGTLCVIEPGKITNGEFPIARRMYYITNNSGKPDPRGGHYHPYKEEILFIITGEATFHLRTRDGREDHFVMNDPRIGLFMPANVWHMVTLCGVAVLGVLSPREYASDESVAEFT